MTHTVPAISVVLFVPGDFLEKAAQKIRASWRIQVDDVEAP